MLQLKRKTFHQQPAAFPGTKAEKPGRRTERAFAEQWVSLQAIPPGPGTEGEFAELQKTHLQATQPGSGRRRMQYLVMIAVLPLFACLFHSCQNTSDDSLILQSLHSSVEFTRPDPVASTEERNRVRDRIVRLIDNSRVSILVLAYGLEDPAIIEALIRSRRRGVDVRTVLSPEKEYSALKGTGIPEEVRNDSGLQHVKAMLIDNRHLITGTGNFTRSGLFYNNNAFLFLRMPVSMGRMIRLRLLDPNIRRPFLKLPGLTILFSPEGGRLIQSVVAREIYRAGGRVRFMMFRFTDPVLATLLYNRARRGVPVEGILDGSGPSIPGRSVMEEHYYEAGLLPVRIYIDGNENQFQSPDGIYHGGHLHHKTAIIDDTLITGSYNWSMSARDQNREIVIVSHRQKLLSAFNREFLRLRRKASVVPRPMPGVDYRLPWQRESRICFENGNQPQEQAGGSPSATAAESAVAIRGSFAFFHAVYHEKESQGAAPCRSHEYLSRRTLHTAGAARGEDYFPRALSGELLGPLGSSRSLPAESEEYESGLAGWEPGNLCAPSRPCFDARLHRLDAESGWLQIEAGSPPTQWSSMYVLSRNGWTMRPLRRVDRGFYRFSPLPYQDLLLFMIGPDGEYAACVIGGAMDSEIRRYLQFLRYYGSEISCIDLE